MQSSASRSGARRMPMPWPAIPPDAWRVEYGRTGVGAYVRVRVDEAHLPESLTTT